MIKNVSDGDEVVKKLKNLKGRIPGLISIDADTDTNRGSAAYDSYQDHPEHVEVKLYRFCRQSESYCGFSQLIFKKKDKF